MTRSGLSKNGVPLDSDRLNRWLTLGANVGVLIGLALLIVEIRQSTAISQAEHSREVYLAWTDIADMELQSNLAPVVIKSYAEPDQLTAEEIYKLNSWLISVMSLYVYGSDARELGVATEFSIIDEPYATYLFGSRYARHWFDRNRWWLGEGNIEVIDRVIRENPELDKWPRYGEYYQQ